MLPELSNCATVAPTAPQDELLTLREVCHLAKISGNTARAWANSGAVIAYRTKGNKRRWSKLSLLDLLGARRETVIDDRQQEGKIVRVLAYARVSSRGQANPSSPTVEKSSLDHQVERLKAFIGERFRGQQIEVVWVKNVKSGLDFENESFLNNVIRPIIEGKFSYLVIQDKTRLARFAYSLIEYLCRLGKCEILHVLDEREANRTENELLMDDLLSVLTCFTASSNSRKAKLILQVNVEPEVIKQIVHLHTQFHSTREIARQLEKENKVGIDGRPITKTVVRRIIAENKGLIGQLKNGAKYTPNGDSSFLLFCRDRVRVAGADSVVSFTTLKEVYKRYCYDSGLSPETCDRRLAQLLVRQMHNVQLGYDRAKKRLYRGLAILSE